MKLGILTRNERSWCSLQLKQAAVRFGLKPFCFSFSDIGSGVAFSEKAPVEAMGTSIDSDFVAIIVRPISGGSAEEIFFRLDLLHRIADLGTLVVNPPLAIEKAADKYRALALLDSAGLPVPKTFATEDPRKALEAFDALGRDVVLKPIFGSRGVGVARIKDRDVLLRICRSLKYFRHVIYLQEFVEHGTWDIRAFVLGERVIASMRRVAGGWKTNIAQGAIPASLSLPKQCEELAIKAAKVLGCHIAGVDILETRQKKWLINEVNSQPDWRGLQSVTGFSIADAIVKYVISISKHEK
ncbi:MAG: RimK family alpha-L-glutamate ligase [Candidatus Bathyarchaeia archaeon]